ncbi:MAG TPA: hypothetical protein VE954_12745 [Oligoflexus sp.]|uniref:hypothetical protein n=1 Tax=Oligoflexus sp. TaxID=1971216 RepID=UPI002D6FCABC|nr:hypothetical protein [Oligoflexus sp.]HYX33976.1 hypothetical protein [Oligoflexus sp.]
MLAAEKEKLPQFHGVYDLAAADLAVKAMNERWTQTSFAVAKAVAQYVAVSGDYRYCASADALPTVIITCSTIKDIFHARENGLLFAPYGRRYEELAKMLSQHQAEWLHDSRYFTARYTIEKEFFKPVALWSLCPADTFASKQQALDQQLQAYQKAATFTVRNQLEKDITATLANCP